MAVPHPPGATADDFTTASEFEAFTALCDGLDDGWEIFHSIGVMLRDHAEGAQAGEIDLVLCHPERGIVCLEVKGQGVECQGGQWYRKRNGRREKAKDPFEQAVGHAAALKRILRAADPRRGADLFVAHAIAFPRTTVHGLVLPHNAPAEILLDRTDLTDPAPAIDRLLAFHAGARDKRRMPGQDGAALVRETLAPDVLITRRLVDDLLDYESELILLTAEESRLLRRMASDPRMVITGCAGSGKTMLAVEHARRLAGEGKRVLFVCFNRRLRDHLRKRERCEGVTYQNFHGLCTWLAQRAKVALPDHGDGETPQSYWDVTLPEALVEAAAKLDESWDALIVDEAQDLEPAWFDALTSVLADPDTAPIWLFMDDNQNVFAKRFEAPPQFRPFELTVNCRNTQKIHAVVMSKYKGSVVPEAGGPVGIEPEIHHTADDIATVGRLLDRLTGPDGVPAQDIVVLSSHGETNSRVLPDVTGRCTLALDPEGPDQVRFCSIRGFKGLESPVVVLCELGDLDEKTMDAQLYVGLSRARTHAIIVAPPAV